MRAGVGCGSVCRNAGCGQDPARAWGALGLRKGGGSCGEFSRGIGSSGLCGKCEGQLLGGGGSGWVLLPKSSCHHGQSLLAPRGLFEAETTRGCAKAGC